MNLEEVKKIAIRNAINYGEEYNIEMNQEFAHMKLYEELGEFTQAILIHQKRCRPEKHIDAKKSKEEMAKELADVLGMVMVNAHLLDIDIEEAYKKKWVNRE